MDTYVEKEKTERKINRKWIDVAILASIVIAEHCNMGFYLNTKLIRTYKMNLKKIIDGRYIIYSYNSILIALNIPITTRKLL